MSSHTTTRILAYRPPPTPAPSCAAVNLPSKLLNRAGARTQRESGQRIIPPWRPSKSRVSLTAEYPSYYPPHCRAMMLMVPDHREGILYNSSRHTTRAGRADVPTAEGRKRIIIPCSCCNPRDHLGKLQKLRVVIIRSAPHTARPHGTRRNPCDVNAFVSSFSFNDVSSEIWLYVVCLVPKI